MNVRPHPLCLLLLAAAALHSTLAAASASPQSYRLALASEFSTPGADAAPARGRFLLTPIASPLDWDMYALDLVRLELSAPGAPVRVLEGTGTYRIGGRGIVLSERLTLDLSEAGQPVKLDSGEVPASRTWPALDLQLASLYIASPLKLRLVASPVSGDWRYRLIADSQFLDDCALCDRPPLPVRVRGGFDLGFIPSTPLFERYALFNLHFTDSGSPPAIEITGEGEVEIGGEVAVRQTWRLDVQVKTPAGGRRVIMTNVVAGLDRRWPMLKAALAENGGTDLSRYFLDIQAAPIRELWFNTVHGLTSGLGPPDNHITGADILDDTGRVVCRGTNLLAAVGLPPETDTRIDAFDVRPGGEITFSLTSDAKSPTLGAIQEGDALSERGIRLMTNQELTTGFGIMPTVPDLGLDALRFTDNGEWVFSTRTPAFSEQLGVMLGRGDLLGGGRVLHTNRELLEKFKPSDPDRDYGLDAFYVWPSGEIWFSTEDGFQAAGLGAITDGDLLSSDGYVVARNLDLVGAFQPLEDLANFGFQGLFLVSDAAVSPDEKGPVTSITLTPAGAPVIAWKSLGRVFQVEAAGRLNAPFVPVSPVIPRLQWTDEAPALERYFRVGAW